ncbi:glycosyltransferase family 2 protein [Paraflavitalea speifideaquila]|uniref:glycosyltransferase family 2 protein n=1 Tax=Paraflavitalea speifideaquila TaxID=3076558 RepID=UPI0028E1D578|nr:glycosyltransferase [Paraflavitalea speifideiaquila]
MNTPLISVCVVTYNHENYITQCLEGILMQQTNFPFEIVVGEDCSTDNTRAIIKHFEQQYPGIIKPIYHEHNVGAARNHFEHCFSKIQGRYIAICDGDDYWTDPGKLQKQVDFMEQNPACVLCFHRVKQVDQHNNIIQEQEPLNTPVFYQWHDILHISIPTLSVVFRNCLDHFPEEIFSVKSGDTFLFGMLSRFGGAADLGFVGAHYRVHAGGTYSGKSQVEQYRQTIHTRKLMQRSPYFSKEQTDEIKKEVDRRKLRYIKHFMKKGQVTNCLKILFT